MKHTFCKAIQSYKMFQSSQSAGRLILLNLFNLRFVCGIICVINWCWPSQITEKCTMFMFIENKWLEMELGLKRQRKKKRKRKNTNKHNARYNETNKWKEGFAVYMKTWTTLWAEHCSVSKLLRFFCTKFAYLKNQKYFYGRFGRAYCVQHDCDSRCAEIYKMNK